jgi:predicted transcriptional regulator
VTGLLHAEFPSDKNAEGKILSDQTNEQKFTQSETSAQIQPKQKGKVKITQTGGKNNFSVEISTDLLRIKEVSTLPLSFNYLEHEVQILAH